MKRSTVECSTAYGGQLAIPTCTPGREDHGCTAIANVDIMDENSSMTLPVEGASNLTENYVDTRLGALKTMLGGSHLPSNWCLYWDSLLWR